MIPVLAELEVASNFSCCSIYGITIYGFNKYRKVLYRDGGLDSTRTVRFSTAVYHKFVSPDRH